MFENEKLSSIPIFIIIAIGIYAKKEYEKFIHKLKQKVDIKRIYVEIAGQNQRFIDEGELNEK